MVQSDAGELAPAVRCMWSFQHEDREYTLATLVSDTIVCTYPSSMDSIDASGVDVAVVIGGEAIASSM